MKITITVLVLIIVGLYLYILSIKNTYRASLKLKNRDYIVLNDQHQILTDKYYLRFMRN